MKEIEIKGQVVRTCEKCGDASHNWHEVYYGDRATLIKVDKTYIAWCKKMNDYVLANN